MLHRRNRNLRVVNDSEDQTDQIIEDIISELNGEQESLKNMEEQIQKHKARLVRRIIIGVAVVITALAGGYLLIHLQTYSQARRVEAYVGDGAADNHYAEFADGVLRYSRDGIAYLNQKGEEQWNQPYQIKTPLINVQGESAAIADKGGNDILVLQKDGLKGEIHTTLPIEKISVSGQGVVSVILKEEESPRLMCYDAAGNILVEHKTSVSGTGYPLDVALSEDGKLMLVSYLYTQEGRITSKIIYYYFGEDMDGKTDHQVTAKDIDGAVMPTAFFMTQKISAVVGDDQLHIFKGASEPQEIAAVKIDKEIKSVFHNERYIGMVLKNTGKDGYELRLYNTSGKMVMTKNFSGDYSNAKLSGSQVILYDGKKCSIFMRTGVQKFRGEMDSDILEMFPVSGVNKYIVINANGMEVVRLVK